MKYYILEPEVAGGFGPNSVLNPKTRPLQVSQFHYEFEVWLGDPLLEAVGCFIVTESLKGKIETFDASGVSFGEVEISKSGQFEDLYPDRLLPNFVWMQINGRPSIDDFGLSPECNLVVSERILNVLIEAGMSHCGIEQITE